MTSSRLPPRPGEWIDRSRPLRFRFEGRSYAGFSGDCISSALAAAGVRLLGRSFKYHRPRGIYSLANHDVNVLLAAEGQTSLRADVTPVWEGAELTAVNTFGGLEHDRARLVDRASRFLPVGFYYKAFYRPRRWFPFWERRMRAMAGLGRIDPETPRLRTPNAYAWCDVLVVGAGPAGMSAAVAAADQGLQVMLVDENRHLGGSLLHQWSGEPAARTLLRTQLDRIKAYNNLEVRPATVAAGCYADRWLALVDHGRLTKLRAEAVVMAAGAVAQPALFRHNDVPGVMLATAAQRLLHLYAVKPCQRAVVLAANADAYRAALDLHEAGVTVAAVVDLRPQGDASDLARKAGQAGIPLRRGHAVTEAVYDDQVGLEAVVACPLGVDGEPRWDEQTRIECDGLLMSTGWAPADSLFCQAGGKMAWSPSLEQFVPARAPDGVFPAGRLNGIYDLEQQVADGMRAGDEASRYVLHSHGNGESATMPAARSETTRHSGPSPSHPFPVVKHPAGKVFVDLDEDVQLADIEHAVQEGFDSVELLKRYSTFGMGPSQGKIANTNTIRVLARLRGLGVDQVGSPTARPFYHPVPLAHLAGRGFHPRRRTPLHGCHEAAGAVFIPAGEWLRPGWYDAPAAKTPTAKSSSRPAPADRQERIWNEVRAVRERAGLIDVGTLGKIEISGPQAAEFVERIYTGRFANLPAGSTRYALMCDESGVVIDDGVVARLADDRFYVTTTTTASTSVYREMQRWAILWGTGVVLSNVTGGIAAINLAGPQAPGILARLSNVATRDEAFPFRAVREAVVLDVPARLLRTGFVGEVAYEIHVAADWAARLWQGILEAGREHGIRPFGVEAQRVLRLEKGHAIVSQDTDGLTTPFEAGMGWAVKADKPFFVGGRSLAILSARPLKRRLVGFTLPPLHAGPVPEECHLVIEGGEIVGRVTSISHSPTLGRVIGLAYVPPAMAEAGTEISIRAQRGVMVPAVVVKPPFYDPHNLRQRIA